MNHLEEAKKCLGQLKANHVKYSMGKVIGLGTLNALVAIAEEKTKQGLNLAYIQQGIEAIAEQLEAQTVIMASRAYSEGFISDNTFDNIMEDK